uniref:Uncharacterized protein n=1 Tax=Ascaris lumbricoides TaxID=6252 RepID=A0A9J2P3P1_ASCLU
MMKAFAICLWKRCSALTMFVTRQVLLCLLLIYLLAQPLRCSWLSKKYEKLENSAKKRIAEGIGLAIQGGPCPHRFVELNDIAADIEMNESQVSNIV